MRWRKTRRGKQEQEQWLTEILVVRTQLTEILVTLNTFDGHLQAVVEQSRKPYNPGARDG